MRPVQFFQTRRKLIRFERAFDKSLPGFEEKLGKSSWAVYPGSRLLRRAALQPGGPSAALITRAPALQASEETQKVGIHGISRQPGLVPVVKNYRYHRLLKRRQPHEGNSFRPPAFDDHRSSVLPFTIPEGIMKTKRFAPM
jgi:hypothetical protein